MAVEIDSFTRVWVNVTEIAGPAFEWTGAGVLRVEENAAGVFFVAQDDDSVVEPNIFFELASKPTLAGQNTFGVVESFFGSGTLFQVRTFTTAGVGAVAVSAGFSLLVHAGIEETQELAVTV